MLSGAAKERDKLTDISKKSKRLGYQQEADSLYVIDHLLSHATTMSQPFMRIDPVSKSLISLIASNVSFFGGYLQVTDSNRIDSKEPNKLYGRLADIFKYVLKPCFNNVKNLDGYVWTGSTSEGFAITDHSKQGVRYLNDEMDLMIPVAMVAESTKTDDSSACGDSTGVSERGRLEESSTAEIPVEDIGRIVSQLEEVGMAPPSDDPPLEWVPTSPPGYVRVRIRGDRKHNFSEEFINEACCIIPFGGHDEIYLSRLKLLKIQEAHVLSRIPAVQSDIDKNFKTFGGFHGCVELVQQGPVQTLSVHYNARSLGSSATTAEFEQTADGALALTCTQWPSMAKDWATRDRKWPTSDVVRAVVEAGCHVVPKSYPGEGGDEYLQWRLSFSLAERTLAHCFSENQRKFYLVIKKIWRMHLKEPSVLSSYHMKTTMFWTSEKIAPHQWRKDMLGDHFISCMDTLIGFLEQGDIPNFFLPENNMVSHLPANDIDAILGKVRHIRKNPLEYTKDVSTPSSTFQMIH
ncbi:uncharacterized protein [Ptychodera flava]|uniref:uncharacterized protein isoform X2 n=1 Tax=Ptychodera flava TaxID=63121 RepID=UPI00396A5BE0